MERIKFDQIRTNNGDIMAGAFFNLADPALILDDSGRIVEINQACSTIFKVTRRDLIGHSILDMLPTSETERKRVKQFIQTAKQSDSTLSINAYLPTGEKRGQWTLINLRNFTHDQNSYSICTLIDISALVGRDHELQAEEEKGKSKIDNANDLIQSVAEDGKIVYANKKWLDMLGYTEQELSDLHIADIIREDLVPHCFNQLNRVKQGERLEYIETVFLTKDGRQISVEGNIDGHFENGQFINTFGIFRDITKRKMLEESYSLLIQNLPIPVYVARKGTFKFVNAAFRNLVGYSDSELVGSTTQNLIHTEDRLRVYKLAVSALKANNPASYEFRVIKKSGEVRWVLETVISIPYEGGRATLGAMIDVTEQKLFETALNESRTRFQTIFNSASDSIYIHDFDGRLLEVNDATCKMLGYNRSELLKQHVNQIISSRFKPDLEREKHNLLQKGDLSLETENVTRDGKIIPVEIHSRIIEYEKQKVVLVVTRDITERKQIEAIRKRNEVRMESLVKIAQLGMDHHYEILNLSLVEVIKLTDSKCGYIYLYNEGKNCLELNTWAGETGGIGILEDRQVICPVDQTGILGKAVLEGKPIVFNDTQEPSLATNGYPSSIKEVKRHLFYPIFRAGLLTALVSVANKETDYTPADMQQLNLMIDTVWNLLERWQAEDDLKKSEQKYRMLVENQSDLLVETDSFGTITFVNPAYCKFVGFSEKELIGVPGLAGMHPDDTQSVSRIIKELSQPPYASYAELQTHTAQGWRWVAWIYNAVLDSSGKISTVVSIGRDVTEKKLAQEELEKANQRLRELDKLKDSFLSTVSHEMRTPLTSIRSFAEILMNYEEDRPTQKEFLKIINDESERLTRLINDFLDLSKIQAGRMIWKSEPVFIKDAILTAVNSTKTLMDKNKQLFTLSIEPELPQVLSDRDRMIQVVTNLLSNAIKFTPEGGRITLEAKSENKGTPEQVVVSISDTGIGIAPEYHESIFENFGQVGDVLKDRPKGTGLGLPICKKIIENYGGKIWLESVQGKGTTFYFSLPAVIPEKTQT